MSSATIASRFARILFTHCRNSPLIFGARHDRRYISYLANQLPCPTRFCDKVVDGQLGSRHRSVPYLYSFQWFGFSSSPQPNAKDNAESGNEDVLETESGSATESQSNVSRTTRSRRGTKRIAFSDSDSDSELEDLSRDDLVKLVAERKRILEVKQEELWEMKDKVMRTLAEMENVKDRTRRESENSKKFAIQSFAKSLLDVADNLGRASSAAKESFSNIDLPEDAGGAFQQLKVLLEGVEMTEKQLIEVFRKFGVERYDPTDEEFDPNRHNAVFQVPDASKPADRVAVVLKAGYMLHERVIRPAEVGVTVAANDQD
ncbi:Co-chaperone GrpE family protein [Perilla frutescens var. frutescens]|nr:Co-chaperone GrpE family protein [Perilla frutescens var. frutescens]